MAEVLPAPSADCYLAFANELREKCHKLGHIKGAAKLERKIMAEIKFLKNLLRRSSHVQESHLKSSNLSHYAAIVHASENLPGAVAVLQAFSCPGKNESLCVDVVAGQGHIWVKVIARKAQALHLVWAGQGQFGERDLLRQSDDYLDSAEQHPHIYRTPRVYFLFYNNVTFSMAEALRTKGVQVLGHEVPVDVDVEHKLQDLHLETTEDEDEDEDKEDDDRLISASDFIMSSGSYMKDFQDVVQNERLESLDLGATSSNVNSSSVAQIKDPAKSETNSEKTATFERNSESCHHPHAIQLDSEAKSCTEQGANEKTTKSCDNELASSTRCVDHKELHTTVFPSKSEKAEAAKSHAHPSDSSSANFNQNNTPGSTRADQPSPSSSNYNLLMSELLGVLPIIKDNIVDNSMDIINSVSRVNLDITTLITLVSAVTHGHSNYIFTEKILTMQAEEERQEPVLPGLVQFMKGKELYACRSAVDDFSTILATLGGEGEKERARELMTRVCVVEDNPSQKALHLKNLGKIKDRSKIIFGTGDSLEAITMTANSGFLRACKGQGVSFAVFVHAARALTEDKEKTATPI